MKKITLIVALFCSYCYHATAQVLFSFGKNQITKDEFLRAYNKNKPSTTDKAASIKEYLTLFTNFKLKVNEAAALRLDTLPQIQYDLQNFKEQILPNYLNDEKGLQQVVTEAATRSLTDVHIIYFSISFTKDNITDTVKAFNAAKEIYTALKNGDKNYEALANNISAKYTTTSFVDAGFVTAFTLPYAIENIVYNTPVGGTAAPYNNKKGLLVLKVIDQRQNVGKWRTAQILFAFPPNATTEIKAAIHQKADSIYALIKKGLSFDEAAKNFSDDRITYLTGGEMQEFSTGRYNPVFEKNVFALQNNNDITQPFETIYGYHIVKRLSKKDNPSNPNDVAYQFEIKQQVLQDERVTAAKNIFNKTITTLTGFKKLNVVSDVDLYRYADTLMTNPSFENTNALPISKKNIISFKDGTQIKGAAWLQFVRDYKSNAEKINDPIKNIWDNFATQTVVNYYQNNLEKYNADYKYQLQEFKEGNMLFEVMERNVWSKAGSDSIKLQQYYNEHKTAYVWQPSADIIIFNCANEQKATEALQALKNGKSWLTITAESNNQIQADSGRYELAQIPGIENMGNPTTNAFSNIVKNADGTYVFAHFIRLYEGNQPRSFSEARGLVINDYQTVLETEWVNTLRKKYPVTINQQVLNSILQ
ncbi:peptidylprolyl isomerase [Ferruginibacter yonginensis]|uniref:Peptidylprolyl isomerase n=1 Tax=Ferruginibacter yonginensis TaxID=1310416 RepID=A0ABV8QTD9_9BACT